MNGIDLLFVIAGLLLLLVIERYAAWRRWDHYRRLQRDVHRNLVKEKLL